MVGCPRSYGFYLATVFFPFSYFKRKCFKAEGAAKHVLAVAFICPHMPKICQGCLYTF